MKKTFYLLLIMAFSATVNAQTSDKKWSIGAGAGAYGTIKHGEIGIMPELYLSRYLNKRFDLMFRGNFGAFRTNTNNDLDFATLFLNLRYKLSNEIKTFRPYLFAGPGLLDDNSVRNFNFDAGLGARFYFNPKLSAYFEAGYINGIGFNNNRNSIYDNYWKNTAGLEFNFGKTKDSDMDGVSDKKDKCPDTPTGVVADENGCPVDTDGDGVADNLDDCPTIAGLSSLKGCPDADKDGVTDKDDACPDVAGIVSLKGCPDTDGDGIGDKEDKCPDTKKGWKVDASGCPLDQDKDGVADSEDDCPTVAGPKENKGCPAKDNEVEKKKELTLDQIEIQNIKGSIAHFVSGKIYLTDFSKGELDKLVKILNENKDYYVNIFGHADNEGSDESNLKLSEARIGSTIQYIESKGISGNRIISQNAIGEAKPVATNSTPEGRLLNRRVEFEIFKMK